MQLCESSFSLGYFKFLLKHTVKRLIILIVYAIQALAYTTHAAEPHKGRINFTLVKSDFW